MAADVEASVAGHRPSARGWQRPSAAPERLVAMSNSTMQTAANAPSDRHGPWFERLFLAADAARTGRVDGAAAVAFFGRAGLPVTALKQIWLRADAQQQGFLTRSSFNVALRLVAMAQQGRDISTADVQEAASDAPLPVFQGSRGGARADGLIVACMLWCMSADRSTTWWWYAVVTEELVDVAVYGMSDTDDSRYNAIFREVVQSNSSNVVPLAEAIEVFRKSALDNEVGNCSLSLSLILTPNRRIRFVKTGA